jgi:hypothetical protein
MKGVIHHGATEIRRSFTIRGSRGDEALISLCRPRSGFDQTLVTSVATKIGGRQ